MIKRIKIEGYKSFKSLDLKLSPISVIFGPNASGKSNLLDAIQLLSRMATCKTLGEAFEGHRGFPLESFYYGDVGFEEMLKKDKLKMSFEVDLELSERIIEELKKAPTPLPPGSGQPDNESIGGQIIHRSLRYSAFVEACRPEWEARLKKSEVAPIDQEGKINTDVEPFWKFPSEYEGQKDAFLFQNGGTKAYQTGSARLPLGIRGFFPHVVAFILELEQWKTWYPDPKAMREKNHIEYIRQIGPRGEKLAAFLNVLEHDNPKSFENFNLTLSQALPLDHARIDIVRDEPGMLSLRLVEDGISYPMRLISDGTLRLIGLLAALDPESPATVICIEEPENGVHPTRIRLIAEILKNAAEYYGKQIIVTTHSPLFAEYFDDEQLFVCRKEDEQTTIEPFKPIGETYRQHQIERALQDRIPRGDFGG